MTEARNIGDPINLGFVSEMTVAYALHKAGTDPRESPITRLRMATALRELGHPLTAQEIEDGLHSVRA